LLEYFYWVGPYFRVDPSREFCICLQKVGIGRRRRKAFPVSQALRAIGMGVGLAPWAARRPGFKTRRDKKTGFLSCWIKSLVMFYDGSD